MSQNGDVKALKVVLIILAVIAFVYGFGFLFVPGILVGLSRANPVEFSWLRWMGGVVIALGIGALMVSSKPEKQGIFVTSMALATLFAGLGNLYSWIMQEYSGATWFTALPTCFLLVLSGLLWWGRGKAKGIL
jgi:thiamine transporter ThiT